jgi:hypothetical protein
MRLSSTVGGNALVRDKQIAKLRLVVEQPAKVTLAKHI